MEHLQTAWDGHQPSLDTGSSLVSHLAMLAPPSIERQ
jgi:hypothetical protein